MGYDIAVVVGWAFDSVTWKMVTVLFLALLSIGFTSVVTTGSHSCTQDHVLLEGRSSFSFGFPCSDDTQMKVSDSIECDSNGLSPAPNSEINVLFVCRNTSIEVDIFWWDQVNSSYRSSCL